MSFKQPVVGAKSNQRPSRRPVNEREQPEGLNQSSTAVSGTLSRALDHPQQASPSDLLRLQRAAGNRAVTRLTAKNSQSRTPEIQLKRQPPEDGNALAEYQEKEQVYEAAKTKGQGYLEALRQRKQNFIPGQQKPQDIQNKSNATTAMIQSQFTTEMEVEEQDAGVVEYDMDTTHNTNKKNNYHNFIYFPTGKIVADWNKSGKNPKPPANSELLWYQYSQALEHYRAKYANDAQTNIAEITRESITNKETKKIIWMVFDNDVQDEKTVTPDSDDGKALLGSPNGKSSVWLLVDHLEELGNKNIQSIKLDKTYEGKPNMKIIYG